MGKDLSVTASAGITTSASRYPTEESMLRDADTVMYWAKANGRGRHMVFGEAIHSRAVERPHLESELRQAVEREEFILECQPIVSLLDELHHLGVRLSMDDFGQDARGQTRSEHRKNNYQPAHNLRMNVIAEGAETAEQIRQLNGMNCDCVEGYFSPRRFKLENLNAYWKSSIPPGTAGVSAACQSQSAEFQDSTARFVVRRIA